MKILLLDRVHELFHQQFLKWNWVVEEGFNWTHFELIEQIHLFDGIIVRSKFVLDSTILSKAINLKFIARPGAGLENIDVKYAHFKNISTIAAPEGNRNAVGEQSLGMLLSLMNKLRQAHSSIERGEWHREKYRGWELEGKTVGIIGYGNTGKSFAKKLQGFDVKVIFHDIKTHLGDENAQQVSLEELQNRANILSLHIPQSVETNGMIDRKFIAQMKNSFWFLNTSRGKVVVTSALVEGLVSEKILGAGLDVFEYESASFHSIFNDRNRPKSLDYLLTSEKVLLSPHVAGWTFESHLKLAQTIVDKIASEEY